MAGERILVVEDNELNMKLFHDVLQATGYKTLKASTGEEAVELAVSHAPGSRPDGRAAPRDRRRGDACAAATRRTDRFDPRARADGPGDAR